MKKICIKIQLCIHPQRDRHQGAVYHLGLSPEVGLGPEISVIAVLRQGHALHHTELSLYDACWEVLVYHHDIGGQKRVNFAICLHRFTQFAHGKLCVNFFCCFSNLV